MKPLTLEETALLEEMKDMCLNNGDYIDENAKARFYMLCHLEDFGIENWELKQENKQLKEEIEEYKNPIKYFKYANKNVTEENKQLKMINKEYERLNNGKPRGFVITRVDEYDIYDLLRYKENWNKLKEYIRKNIIYDDVGMKILDPSPLEDYIQGLEQGSDSNE